MPDPIGLSICGLAILAGAVLTWLGLFRTRFGRTPYCRRCKYNLTGRVSGICAECGAKLDGRRAIARGECRVELKRLFVGLVFLIVGLGVAAREVYPVVRRINWYAYYPTSWVIADLVGSNKARSVQADAELSRRRKTNSLGADGISMLSAACVSEVARPQPGPARAAIVRQVAALMEANALSDVDRKKFVQELVDFKIETRSQVLGDRPMPVNVRFSPAALLRDFSVKAIVKAWRIDGTEQQPQPMIRSGKWLDLEHPGLIGERDWVFYPPNPGSGRIEVDLDIQVVSNALAQTLRDEPFGRTLSASVKVLDSEPPNYIPMRRSVTLDRTVRDGLILQNFDEHSPAPGKRSLLLVFRPAYPVPIGLAFKVYAAGEDPKSGDRLIIPPGPQGGFEPYSCTITVAQPGPYTVVLEPSVRAAQSRSDLNEIWGGSLVFENIPGPDFETGPELRRPPPFQPMPAKLLETAGN